MARLLEYLVFGVILLGNIAVVAAGTGEMVSTLDDQEAVAVTIYNENLALVKDSRRVTLNSGGNRLAFREVSGRLRPETALFRSVSHPGAIAVIEQNFDFDLLTPAKLLEKYVGRQVRIVKTNPATGEETVEDGQVLSANSGVVLRIGDRIETGIPGRMIFPEVPGNLRDRPTLVMELASQNNQSQLVELSYLTGGLGWKADYVAQLNDTENRLDLNGWVTLTNISGTSYRNAILQLVAGDVHTAGPEEQQVFMEQRQLAYAAKDAAMVEESLLDYHLYTLERPTTIEENQTKQVALLQAAGVTCGKQYLLQGQDYYYRSLYPDPETRGKVEVFLVVENRKSDNLGMPLPKGVVRVYKKDSLGRVQFIGEDRIDHTPENETIRLKLGNAFDVTASRQQSDFRKLSGYGRFNSIFESAYRIELKNAKDEEVAVKIIEPVPGDWEIVSESLPHRKENASTASWLVAVPAKKSAVLDYRVQVRF